MLGADPSAIGGDGTPAPSKAKKKGGFLSLKRNKSPAVKKP